MMNLESQQTIFQEFLLNQSSIIVGMVEGDESLTAEARLKIYHDAYRIRLTEALASNFPVLYQYLGTDNFKIIANAYIEKHPSTYRSIRWFGAELSSYLKSNHPEHPYLEELARFEWSMAFAFDAADCRPLGIDDIARISPDQWAGMRFVVHPSVIKQNFSWNIVSIWVAITNNQAPPALCVSAEAESWVIWRHNNDIHYSTLPPEENFAVNALMKGERFSHVCEGLCRWVAEGDVGLRAASFLKSWVLAGFIINISFEGEDTHE